MAEERDTLRAKLQKLEEQLESASLPDPAVVERVRALVAELEALLSADEAPLQHDQSLNDRLSQA
ncbi:unnamed protein product, partial [marine sediment metagenome]